METELAIIEFENGREAITFSQEMWPDSNLLEQTIDSNYSLRAEQEWLCVVSVCDICKDKDCFFIVAQYYENGIEACECEQCGNRSVYPKELVPEENDDD